jgi:undecaprenyl-diphosphatase
MTLFDIAILALIQGITEFLPISSSGHLVLWPLLTGRPDQGVAMDVAVHLGTLVAVCIYFRAEVGQVFKGTGHILTGRVGTEPARLVWLLALATVPLGLIGLYTKMSGVYDAIRADRDLTLEVIAWATLVGAVLLFLADRVTVKHAAAGSWRTSDAAMLGLAQALAIVPGASRSGVTMTMGRFLGYDRTQSARLALLMAVPAILLVGAVETYGVLKDGDLVVGAELILGAFLSCLAALAALHVMMRMFAGSWTMLPFVIYRLGLGSVLLGMVYL